MDENGRTSEESVCPHESVYLCTVVEGNPGRFWEYQLVAKCMGKVTCQTFGIKMNCPRLVVNMKETWTIASTRWYHIESGRTSMARGPCSIIKWVPCPVNINLGMQIKSTNQDIWPSLEKHDVSYRNYWPVRAFCRQGAHHTLENERARSYTPGNGQRSAKHHLDEAKKIGRSRW